MDTSISHAPHSEGREKREETRTMLLVRESDLQGRDKNCSQYEQKDKDWDVP